MDYDEKRQRNAPRCLECGHTISYGRKDKKYCCEQCRIRHNNALSRMGKRAKRRILAVLDKNYEILDALVRSDMESAWLSDLMAMGFNPGYSTFYRKTGRRDYFHCFDISYVMTPNRLYSISKIQNLSLTLPAIHKESIDTED